MAKKKRLIKDLTAVGRRVRSQRGKTNSPLWRRKALRLWSVLVRRAGKCEVCGREASKCILNAHHLLPKERYQHLMFQTINGIALCQNCHKTGRLSAHLNPIWFTTWLQRRMPNRFDWCLNWMNTEGQAPDFGEASARLIRKSHTMGVSLRRKDRKFFDLARRSLEALNVPV